MNTDVLFLMVVIGLIPLCLLVISCALAIPKAVESFQKLQQVHRAANFTEAVGWMTIAFSFLSIVYVTWVRFAMHYESYIESQAFKVILSLSLLFLIFYFLIPNTYSFFKRWKMSKKPADFSLSVFFAFFSLVTLSWIYLRVMVCVVEIKRILICAMNVF